MSDIFLSYAREDEDRVRPIVEQLEAQGWSVFWDLNIPPGMTFRQYIEKNLDAARCVVVVWSKNSVSSHWVQEEADEGRKKNILVPLRIDQVVPPLGLRSIQAADMTAWNKDTGHSKFNELVNAIAALVPKRIATEDTMVDVSVTPVALPIAEPKLLENFVLIRGGQFTMGSPEDEAGRFGDEAQHEVKLNDFAMCRYVVTIGEYLDYARQNNLSYDARVEDARLPAVNVSWEDAVAYCRWLSEKQGDGTFRLPTEAEWEYACRAGTATPFNTGENLTTDQANYNGDYPYRNYPKGAYREKTVPVDSFQPNGYGLYNMHGNVWEWCRDWYDETYYDECLKRGVVENPSGPSSRSIRVLRGGGWGNNARNCRSAYRFHDTPGYHRSDVGFRLVFVPQL